MKLDLARQHLDEVMAALEQPLSLQEWAFWQGPAEQMSETEGSLGDTSQWQAKPRRWSTAAGDVWLRATAQLPASVEGISTQGSLLEMLCTLLVKSRIFVNGEVAAGHDWWLDAKIAPIPLAESYQPGEGIEIACHIPQGDGLGGFGGARIRCQSITDVQDELELLRAQLTFSAFLVSRDRDAARREAWERLADQLPWEALGSRDWSAWWAGVAAPLAQLDALVPEAKDFLVHAAAHAHIDMNWLWPWEDTVDVIQRDFATMDALMAKYPDLRFSQSQASTYWAMEVYRPDLLERVKERVKEGRWEVTANTWVENDLNMSCGEAIARHFLYTRRYMRDLFGVAPRVLWEPDTFGHPATVPQIARKGGAEFYYFCRGGKSKPLFWWESPDGSRLLSFQDPDWYLGDLTPRVVVDLAIKLAEEHDLSHSLVMYGVGDHGGGATIRDLEMAKRINGALCMPTLKLDSVAGFFDAVAAADPDLPVVHQELNPVFAGCYTSHADVKRLNRRGEAAMLDAEVLATVAALEAGKDYPQAALEHHWRTVLLQQFHDILCGCGIGLTSKTAHAWAEPAIASAQQIAGEALKALTDRLQVAEKPALAVFNTLPWSRTDVVRAPLDWPCAWVRDDGGTLIPAQRDGDHLTFVAQGIPGLGCRVYHPVQGGAPGGGKGVWSPGGLVLENDLLRLEVDERSGAISRLVDKEAGRDLTQHAHRDRDRGAELDNTGVLNRMHVWWEQPHGMSAWKLGNISRVDHLVSGAQVALLEEGPVRGTIQVQRQFLHSSLIQRIMLYRGARRIDFETEIRWHEKGSETADAPMLRVSFEPLLGQSEATFQIPFGAITRPADGQEVAAQMWADLSETGGSYGVALLNDSKYGHQAHGNTLGLTLVRASYEPDQNPDGGLHRFTYALYPHLGSWKEAQVEQRAQELNRPLRTRLLGQESGVTEPDAQPGQPAVECQGDGVVVSTFKLAEDGEGVILRLYELYGQETTAALRFSKPVASAAEVSLAEEPVADGKAGLLIRDGALEVTLKPYEIRTLCLQFD